MGPTVPGYIQEDYRLAFSPNYKSSSGYFSSYSEKLKYSDNQPFVTFVYVGSLLAYLFTTVLLLFSNVPEKC